MNFKNKMKSESKKVQNVLIYFFIFLFLYTSTSCGQNEEENKNFENERGRKSNVEFPLNKYLSIHSLSDHDKQEKNVLNKNSRSLYPFKSGVLVQMELLQKDHRKSVKNKENESQISYKLKMCPEYLEEYFKIWNNYSDKKINKGITSLLQRKSNISKNFFNSALSKRILFTTYKFHKYRNETCEGKWNGIVEFRIPDWPTERKYKNSFLLWIKENDNRVGFVRPPKQFQKKWEDIFSKKDVPPFREDITYIEKEGLNTFVLKRKSKKETFKTSKGIEYTFKKPVCIIVEGIHIQVYPVFSMVKSNKKKLNHMKVRYYAPGIGLIAKEYRVEDLTGQLQVESSGVPRALFAPELY